MDLSRDEAALMLAALACSSDGQGTQDEEDVVRRRLAPHLARLGEEGQQRTFERLYQLLSDRGRDWALDTIGRALPNARERVAALRLTAELVRSDGSVTREEMEHLEDLADVLGISQKERRAILA